MVSEIECPHRAAYSPKSDSQNLYVQRQMQGLDETSVSECPAIRHTQFCQAADDLIF